ncbi:MAG: hypothetical protein C3F07_19110 [Anaerolineales bacterium]|nr:MAG: hypothetical protein C3F07_19110 [Anaerolineales bacterium]
MNQLSRSEVMNEPIRILIIEDLETDIELAQREIRRSIKNSIFQNVSTRKDFLEALNNFNPDIILSDYSMPRFDGMKALELTLEHSPLTPFIIWTGSMSEEVAAECIKAGANNYVLKENIKRLGPAIVRALEERWQLLELKIAEQKYQDIFENSPEGIFQSLPQGRYIKINPAMARIYGYDSAQDMLESITNIGEQVYVDNEGRDEFLRILQAKGVVEKFEQRNYKKDGSIFWSSTSARAVRDEEGNILYFEGFLQDITERKQAEIERQTLFEIMQGLASTRDLGEFLRLLHASISKVIHAENIFVVYHQKETGLFEEIYTVDQFDPPAEPSKLERSITSYVFRTGEPIIMTRPLFEELQANGEVELVGTNSQSWLGAPLRTPNGIIGVMAVQDYENPNRYSERDKDFLASIASQVALVIERMQTEKEEREQRSLAEALRDTAESLNSTLDFGEVLDQILAAVGKVVPHDAATIMLIEKEHAHVVRARGYKERGFDTQVMEIQLSLEDTANLKKMYDSSQPVVVSHTQADPNWKKLPSTDWLKSNVGTPISIRDEVVGFILLDSETTGFFSPVHAERLKAFANQAGIAIHNARLLQQAQDEIIERKQAEEKLQASELRHRALFENTPVAIWEEDFSELKNFLDNLREEGVSDFRAYFKSHPEKLTDCAHMIRVLDVNNAALQMYEAESKQALIEETVRVLTTGEQDHNLEDFLAIAQGRTDNQWDGTDETLPGRPLEISLTWSVVPGYEEDYSKVIVTTVDVTAQKQAERERAERLKEMTCLYAVRREMGSGLSLDELCERIAQHLSRAMQFPEITAPVIEVHGRVYASEKHYKGLRHYISAEITGPEGPVGRVQVFYTEDKPFIIPEEQNLINSIADDLRLWLENRRAEEQLRSSEERFRQMAENIQEGFWLTDAITGEDIYMSPAIGKIWGRPIDRMMRDPKVFMDSILPEDREKVAGTIKKQQRGHQTEMEYRIVRPDGTVRWVRDRAFPILDESGRAIRVAGIAADITERKQTEEELQARDALLRESQKIARLGHYDLDIAAGIWESSEALDEILGIDNQYLRDVSGWINLVHPTQREEMRKYFVGHVLEGGQPFDREYRIVRANDQQERWVHGLGRLEYDEPGKLVRMIGTIQDITERKQTESEIKRHLAELEALYENGLAVGRLLKPKEIGDRIISTFERHLSWHHVTIRLLKNGDRDLDLVAYSAPHLNDDHRMEAEGFNDLIHEVGQGLSGWVVQTGVPIRTGNVHAHSQYVDAYPGIRSGLYMPLKIGERVIGVISVESEETEAFSAQDERLLATLANQAAIAFENARLYRSIEDERQRFMDLFENSPVPTWLEDFSEVVEWMEGLRKQGVEDLRTFLTENPEEVARAVNRIRVLDINHAAVLANAARSKQELMEQIHGLLTDEATQESMINEFESIWNGLTSFEFEMSFNKLDGETKHAIQRIFIPVNESGQVDYQSVILTSTDITDRVVMEQALRSSEVHYRELADSITDIFFELDHDMRYTHWNKAIETLTGIPTKEAIGKSMYDIFGRSKEQERISEIYKDILRNQRPRTFGTALILNEEKHSFEINAYPSTHGVSVVAKDVTDRKRLEMLAQKRFELMEFSARHSLEEVMQRTMDEICDLTGSAFGFFHFIEEDENTLGTKTWSTNVLKLFRVPDSAGTHLPVDQAGVWAEALRQRKHLIQNDIESLPQKKELPEGHPKIVREIVIPIIRNEKIAAVMGIANKEREYNKQDLETAEQFADYAWDVTERKQMELALAEERDKLAVRVEERTADLIRANSNLARAIRVKDEFLANMSHELRTPLNAILGLSESLGEQIAGPLNEKQLKYITTISESGHHLLALINDILDLAKIEAGHLTLDINKVDVNSVCQASLRMVKQLAMNKNQTIEFRVEDGIGLMWADERRLKQMIVNLLSNAVKFTPENKTIGLEVRGDREENRIEISIWDNGIGIDRNELTRLFQPFVQLDAGLARESTGTGLGLALVAQMARLHGGSVSAASEPNRGSRFTISLPWEPALAPDVAKKLKNTGKLTLSKTAAKTKKTILLIEDTTEVIMMLKDYLESAGYNIATAQDGIDGIAEANLVQPDLILMDIQMPRMDGIETTKKLRSDPRFKHTPIIALTALAMPHDRERCIEAGMDEYISKPVNLQALTKIIQSCLSPEPERTDRK